MPCFVHARRRPEGTRFRLWSTIVDAYCCEPLEREAFIEWLIENGKGETAPGETIGGRLDRAARAGTSSLCDGPLPPDLLDQDWETERCDGPRGCGGFHHEYEARVDGSCRRCGNPKSSRSHGEPCQ